MGLTFNLSESCQGGMKKCTPLVQFLNTTPHDPEQNKKIPLKDQQKSCNMKNELVFM